MFLFIKADCAPYRLMPFEMKTEDLKIGTAKSRMGIKFDQMTLKADIKNHSLNFLYPIRKFRFKED